MAAGIGSRFGGGIKQLEPVGPSGEIIMDYSIMDALDAGFDKIVFIIRKDLETDFRNIIGNRIEKLAHTEYVFQELDDLPEGFEKPEGRTKPWGTGQAILCCKDVIKEPFVVINADDYYGKEAFVKIHDFLISQPYTDIPHFCMAGFILKNTLSEYGGVTRGICEVGASNELTAIHETKNIIKTPDGAAILQEDGKKLPLSSETHVSMNMWGFTPQILPVLETKFTEFLKEVPEGNLTAEYLLPTIIDDLLRNGQASVTMLETSDKWFGVTYKEDKPFVVKAIQELIQKGLYQ